MELRRNLQRFLSPFRKFGLLAGALYAADRLLRPLSPGLGIYCYEFMVQPIGDKALLPPNLAKNLRFTEIGRGHPAVDAMPARAEIKSSRFDQGAICLGAYRKDTLIGYAWFCFKAYEEDEVRCTYELAEPERSVFDFDFYILPEHRMGIGFLAIWHGANEYLRARHIRYTFSRLTRFNLASRKAHAHLGWKRVGRAVFFQAWKLELMLADRAPFVFLSTPGGKRPRLRLTPEKLTAAAAWPSGDVR